MQKETIYHLTQELNDTKELLQTLSYLSDMPRSKPQLLIDVSGIKRYDSKTGIPRVVKNQIKNLKTIAKEDFDVKTIYLSEDPTHPLHFYEDTNEPIALAPSDIIYNPDLDPQSIDAASIHAIYTCYKNIGVKIVTLIHDILPITHPHFFVANQDTIHTLWLQNILAVSDLLITTSEATLEALKAYTPTLPKTAVVPLGVEPSTPTATNIPNPTKLDFLIVGTLEPRKGHAQLLDAFEHLWADGFEATLTIVGKKGWHVEELVKRIQNHPQAQKQLLYKEFVNDEELQLLYQSASALLVPSYAEGFGLPIIEAARYNLPLILRDIPVFKEVAKEHAFYFKNTTQPQLLAKTIYQWSQFYKKNTHPQSKNIPIMAWNENAKLLKNLLFTEL
jgi:glycosyltransferase involved in cell wall biosynthesis